MSSSWRSVWSHCVWVRGRVGIEPSAHSHACTELCTFKVLFWDKVLLSRRHWPRTCGPPASATSIAGTRALHQHTRHQLTFHTLSSGSSVLEQIHLVQTPLPLIPIAHSSLMICPVSYNPKAYHIFPSNCENYSKDTAWSKLVLHLLTADGRNVFSHVLQ